jgi:hypothetical protein
MARGNDGEFGKREEPVEQDESGNNEQFSHGYEKA